MTRVGSPSPGMMPASLPQGAPASALLAEVPPALRNAGLGAFLTGTVIERGCGSFDLRGTCVNIAERPGHVPICLASDLRLRRRVEAGELLTMDDIELPETAALAAWQAIERRVLGGARSAMAS